MKRVLITGSGGFIGKNLRLALSRNANLHIENATSSDSTDSLTSKVSSADFIFHLAGSNRPAEIEDFHRVNVDVTRTILEAMLKQPEKKQTILFSSSIQAEVDNPYGRSKRLAEELLTNLASEKHKQVRIYRLPNVFGKWSRPNYNSVVATFCHNISHGLPIMVSDPERLLEMVYIDDLVAEWLRELEGNCSSDLFGEVVPILRCTLADLVKRIQDIHAMREVLHVPDLSDRLNFALHATYTSFLDEADLARNVQLRTDERGWLFELTKSPYFGQVFVSTTKPGVTRGNHYHDSKIERFCLIKGEGLIRFRKMETDHVIEYHVDDTKIRTVDIPPGYTHSIENIGDSDMIVLFWANEIFDPNAPDTHFEKVKC